MDLVTALSLLHRRPLSRHFSPPIAIHKTRDSSSRNPIVIFLNTQHIDQQLIWPPQRRRPAQREWRKQALSQHPLILFQQIIMYLRQGHLRNIIVFIRRQRNLTGAVSFRDGQMPDVFRHAGVATEVESEVVFEFWFAVDELNEGVVAVGEGCGEEATRHGSLEAVGLASEIGGV